MNKGPTGGNSARMVIWCEDGRGRTEDVSAAGVSGLVPAVPAYHAALAFDLEDARRRTVLPLLRRGTARTALHGDARDQLDGVVHEAGVREQLPGTSMSAAGNVVRRRATGAARGDR